jgi:hypothetical protein
MRFGTPPHPVAFLLSDHVATWGGMGYISEIPKLDSVDQDFVILDLLVDEHVRYVIYEQ